MRSRHLTIAGRERGSALFATVLLLVFGVLTAGLMLFVSAPAASLVEDRTGTVLLEVKQALIGYAAQRGLPTGCSNPASMSQCAAELTARPGELPCPDTNNDGLAEASCANNRIGRVPWRTLGIPEPRDAAGETLWYAVALPFLGIPSNPIAVNASDDVSSGAINSSTLGNVEVRASNGTGVITSQAVAVVFAPGPAINGQNRSARAADKQPCAPGEAADFRNLCRMNYLESASGVSNASKTGPYIAGIASPTFNDRLLYLTAADLMPVVEMRVGTELKNLLLAYRQGSKCRCYPWADSWKYSGGIADVSVNRGRFPAYQVKPVNWGLNDAENKIPPLPNWVTLNDWHNIVFYSAARQETDDAGKYCFFCTSSPTLTVLVDGVPQAVSALLFTPGVARNGRPANPAQLLQAGNTAIANSLKGYLEDPTNYNKYDPPSSTCPGWDAENASSLPDPSDRPANVETKCDMYVRPSSRAYDRDRLHMIVTQPQSHCATAARALVKASEDIACKTGGGVNAYCAQLAAVLQQCTCKDAATAMTTTPCLNTLSPWGPQCGAPMGELKACVQ